MAKLQTEKEPGFFASRFKQMDSKKKIQYLIIILVAIVILAIFFASESKAPVNTKEIEPMPLKIENEDLVEQKLKCILSRIEGAGDVEVMITYETGTEIVPAISKDTQITTKTDTRNNDTSTTNTENTQSEVVTLAGGNSALVIKEKSPIVKGVIVVATGADNIAVKLNLINAVKTVLNIDSNQVDVYKMK